MYKSKVKVLENCLWKQLKMSTYLLNKIFQNGKDTGITSHVSVHMASGNKSNVRKLYLEGKLIVIKSFKSIHFL